MNEIKIFHGVSIVNQFNLHHETSWGERKLGSSLRTSAVCIALIISLTLATLGTISASEDVSSAIPEDIKRATCSIYTEQVLGWEYYSTSSQRWTQGFDQTGPVGGMVATVGKVRAVALGVENDEVVFMTLRSFVDPLYPSPLIQGVTASIKDRYQKGFDLEHAVVGSYARYARIKFMWLEPQGGGLNNYLRGVDMAIAFDPQDAKSYEKQSAIIGGNKRERRSDGIEFERPHEQVSVDAHYYYQKLGRQAGRVICFDEHDVALIYLPVARIQETDSKGLPPTLVLHHPTLAVHLALTRSEHMLGFRFNLMGQETMEKIRAYTPPKTSATYPGIDKLINMVGLALDPSTFQLIKAVDRAVDGILPDVSRPIRTQEILAGLGRDRLQKLGMTAMGYLLSR